MADAMTKRDKATYLLVLIVLFFPGTLLLGYALTVLWSWFLLPATGIGTPSIYVAAGLLMIPRMVLSPSPSKPEDSLSDRITSSVFWSFVAPLLTIALAWPFALMAGTA